MEISLFLGVPILRQFRVPLQMTISNTVIPIQMHFLTFLSFTVYYFAHKAGAFSNEKLDVSQ